MQEAAWGVRPGLGQEARSLGSSNWPCWNIHTHPTRNTKNVCLFTEAAIRMTGGAWEELAERQAESARPSNWWLAAKWSQRSRVLPHSGLLFSEGGHQDPWGQASCSQDPAWMPTLSTPPPPPFSGRLPGMKRKGELQRLGPPASGVLLASRLCSQLGQHWLWLLPECGSVWSLQGESQEPRAPVGSRCSTQGTSAFSGWGKHWKQPFTASLLSFLNTNILSGHGTQPFALDTALFKLWLPRRPNNDKTKDNDLERPRSSTCSEQPRGARALSKP